MDLIKSKKFKAALAASVVAIINNVLEQWLGVSLDAATLTIVVGSLLSYVLGQGIADHGKEAAKINGQKKESG